MHETTSPGLNPAHGMLHCRYSLFDPDRIKAWVATFRMPKVIYECMCVCIHVHTYMLTIYV